MYNLFIAEINVSGKLLTYRILSRNEYASASLASLHVKINAKNIKGGFYPIPAFRFVRVAARRFISLRENAPFAISLEKIAGKSYRQSRPFFSSPFFAPVIFYTWKSRVYPLKQGGALKIPERNRSTSLRGTTSASRITTTIYDLTRCTLEGRVPFVFFALLFKISVSAINFCKQSRERNGTKESQQLLDI